MRKYALIAFGGAVGKEYKDRNGDLIEMGTYLTNIL